MRLLYASLFCLALPFLVSSLRPNNAGPYEPTWESLDARPLPGWYDEAKIGIFLHWGVFSVPSFSSEWFWWSLNGDTPSPTVVDFFKKNYRPGMTYQDFASDFTAEFFDPQQWASIFNASGARYVVLTSKHHEGFTNWPSQNSFGWNSMDVGPKRDLVGDLAAAVRTFPNLHFGLYHSLFEWFNPIYNRDKTNGFTTQDFVERKTMPELYELVNRYKPDVIWSDGDAGPDTYWNSTNFLAWLYNESPVKDTVVTNDRWGTGTACKHGGFYTCADRFNPGTLQPHKWENAMTIDKSSWGFRRNAALSDYMNMDDLIALLVETVSCGGNLLVNVGPTKDGRIVPLFEERLRQMGSWLGVNGEAIYGSQPWKFQNDSVTPGIWYTSRADTKINWQTQRPTLSVSVYASILDWPKASKISLYDVTNLNATTVVTMLGYPKPLSWKTGTQGETVVSLPFLTPDSIPCQWVWVLKFENVEELH